MSAHATDRLVGFKDLPKSYFQGKNGLSYRFYVAEDVVNAVNNLLPYAEADRSYINGLYQNQKDVALYVHAPWCVERCTYCYYWGSAEGRREMQRLVHSEQRHARLLDDTIDLASKTVRSIYFGGGTPTVLPNDLLEDCLSFFVEQYATTGSCEITCEASVASLNPQKLDIIEKYATRLSLGVQSFNDRLLRLVERSFTGAAAAEMLTSVVHRFPSVNIDLIYGLQSQTEQEWIASVEKAIELLVPSITIYRLEIREGHPLIKAFRAAPDTFPGEYACQMMRREAKSKLESAGYRENLVGWFLRPNVADTTVYRERWEKQTPCIAFGPGVHNYGADHFYYSTADKLAYITEVDNGRSPVQGVCRLNLEQQLIWYVMAQWKSNSSVSTAAICTRYGVPLLEWFMQLIRDFVRWGLLLFVQDTITLTDDGRSLLEWMLQDMISVGLKRRENA